MSVEAIKDNDALQAGAPQARGFFGRLLVPKGGSDDPSPDVRLGLGIIFAFFVVFLGWAAWARVDSAVTASGTVAVTGSRQEVQHKEGGIISKLYVKEGDHVVKGQILMDLAGDETEANATALMAQYITLKAQEARLLVEQTDRATIPVPPEFANLPPQYAQQIDDAMALQRNVLESRRTLLATQQSVLGQRMQQTEERINGNRQQMTANVRRKELTEEELTGVEDLEAKGYAPKTRVRALQSQIAGLEGEYGALQSDIAGAEAAQGEMRMQSLGLKKQSAETTMAELSDTQARLKTMEPQLVAATASYDRLHVRATATGKVMGLSVFTVGGVIAPGQKLLDIVPDATPLVIQAMIQSKDGNEVRAGQVAQVRFSTLHERDIPILTGKVLDVSGDSFVDKESGHTFYTARVEISPATLATLTRISHKADAIKPGLPVEVVVPLRKRTVLQYLIEPLNQSLWKTFREA